MIPIPHYLRGISYYESSNNETVSFYIRCTCGNDYFSVQENYYTKSELEQIKPWTDATTNLLSGYGSYCTKDSEGKLHHWKMLSPSGSKVEEVIIPEKPLFCCDISIIKLICPKCKSEHIIFDSRKNGYDGVNSDADENPNLYQPRFRDKCRSLMKITIKIENFPSVDEFNAEFGLHCTEEEYSNSFSWIVIYGTNIQGKKRKIFEAETS